LILGSGMGGLALGALLARAGTDVTILEAHPDAIGGWAQTIAVDGYRFSAGPRYLWNFGPGQIGRRFLDKCGLTEQVPLVELDRRGFDHIYVGDEEPICVPNGWSEYEEVLNERFPAEVAGIRRFFALCRMVFRACEVIDEEGLIVDSWPRILWRCFRRQPRSTAWFLLHPYFTLEQAFEACHLSPHLRAVLYGHGGVFAVPPRRLSFPAYVAGTLLYHRGCYFPVGDMAGFVGAIADRIQQNHGQILRGRRVVSARADGSGIAHVKAQTGETFAADVIVVNFDPQTFLTLLDYPGRPASFGLRPFKYSHSASSLFLGVTDARVLRRRFGRWNLWYSAGANAADDFCKFGPLDEPQILYLNCSTFVKGQNNDAPPGHATLTAMVLCSYQAWKQAGQATAPVWRAKHTAMLVDLIDRRFAPGLKDNIGALFLQTPEDKERVMSAPQGNIYGRTFEPRDLWQKISFKGLLPNLYFTGAYVSFGGIAAVIQGACRLYQELTGDRV
jgi:all-trans-retinol 13,14-reductase